jgi:2,4-dienoyl-CoA reductase-like NADH-dependent reductase (Old Yellow Enzyme family)
VIWLRPRRVEGRDGIGQASEQTFAERRHADIMTMAVGLIIHGNQAEQILQGGQADLIAVGREILNNPNWPMDAALKLGVEGPFRNVPPQFGYRLGTRARRGFGTMPSTRQTGLNETRNVL